MSTIHLKELKVTRKAGDQTRLPQMDPRLWIKLCGQSFGHVHLRYLAVTQVWTQTKGIISKNYFAFFVFLLLRR